MATSWFDAKAYFDNKLASMGEGWDSLRLEAAFKAAGYDPLNADQMEAHFNNYGQWENLSPNSLFNANQYLYFKAVEYFSEQTGQKLSVTDIRPEQVKALQSILLEAGMSPWQHYVTYGAWEEISNNGSTVEYISPSANFDSNAYLREKLALMQGDDPAYTMEQLVADFKEAGLTPLTHYLAYGHLENIVPKPVPSGTPGESFSLGYGDDVLAGTAGNDYFFAKLGALNDGDFIVGGAGYDTLEAYVGGAANGGNYATQPTLIDVEKVVLRAQQTTTPSGNNNPGTAAIPVHVDAGDIKGMTYLQNDNSRASLGVEDIRTDSNKMIIGMSNTDSGNVDFTALFNAQNLKAQSAQKTGEIRIEIMDVRNAAVNGNPLADNKYDRFTFQYEQADGTLVPVTLDLGEPASNWSGPTATYASLLTAFQNAIAALGEPWSSILSAELGSAYQATGGSGSGGPWTATGNRINIVSNDGAILAGNNVEGTGWGVSTGIIPPTTGIVTNVDTSGDMDCPLIQTEVHLDNVGRVQWGDANPECLPDNAWYGSESGDLVIGSMATRGGVERFDVKVDRGSWLSSLSSTNNALRLVTVENRDINGDGQNGNTLSEANEEGYGQLFIGRSLADNAQYGELTSWADRAFLLSTDGLVDVKQFEAGTFQGNLNLGVTLSHDCLDKYMKSVDGSWPSGMNGLYAPNGDFTYNLGTASDIINMQIDGGLAADVDFVLRVNGNGGNDFINFTFENTNSNPGGTASTVPTDNQIINSNALRNVVLNGDAGNDTIKVWNRTAVTANGGIGNDVIFVSQAQDDIPVSGTAIGGEYNAVFIFNAPDPAERGVIATGQGAQSLYNDIQSTVDSVTYNASAADMTQFYLTVTFKGITTSVPVAVTGTIDAAGGTTGTIATKALNEAIAKAINDDPILGNLLVAKDGAGYSLLVQSLIDGEMNTTDLTIGLFENADGTTALGGWNGSNEYDTNFATNGAAGADLDGTDTGTTSLNRVWGGAGDDLIVLNVNSTVNWFDVVEYHNEGFLSEGNDIIYNFTTGADKIDFSAYGATSFVGSSAAAVTAAGHLALADIITALGGNFAATTSGGALIQHGATNTYTVVKVVNDATAALADNEVTILGTVTFDNTTGAISASDIITA